MALVFNRTFRKYKKTGVGGYRGRVNHRMHLISITGDVIGIYFMKCGDTMVSFYTYNTVWYDVGEAETLKVNTWYIGFFGDASSRLNLGRCMLDIVAGKADKWGALGLFSKFYYPSLSVLAVPHHIGFPLEHDMMGERVARALSCLWEVARQLGARDLYLGSVSPSLFRTEAIESMNPVRTNVWGVLDKRGRKIYVIRIGGPVPPCPYRISTPLSDWEVNRDGNRSGRVDGHS